jgi:hypothetical protein
MESETSSSLTRTRLLPLKKGQGSDSALIDDVCISLHFLTGDRCNRGVRLFETEAAWMVESSGSKMGRHRFHRLLIPERVSGYVVGCDLQASKASSRLYHHHALLVIRLGPAVDSFIMRPSIGRLHNRRSGARRVAIIVFSIRVAAKAGLEEEAVLGIAEPGGYLFDCVRGLSLETDHCRSGRLALHDRYHKLHWCFHSDGPATARPSCDSPWQAFGRLGRHNDASIPE